MQRTDVYISIILSCIFHTLIFLISLLILYFNLFVLHYLYFSLIFCSLSQHLHRVNPDISRFIGLLFLIHVISKLLILPYNFYLVKRTPWIVFNECIIPYQDDISRLMIVNSFEYRIPNQYKMKALYFIHVEYYLF